MILAKSAARARCSQRAFPAKGATARTPTRTFSVSIIVPVLNEAALIARSLRQLRKHAPSAELIVVDGGSIDQTREIARALCDKLILSNRGRGAQMNAGARVATGEILWFLHADTQVPPECLRLITDALDDEQTVGGFFRIQLPRDHMIYRLTDSFAHYAGKILRIRCGDHGFFCRRKVFEKIGGFPEVPLMEDVEFFRALHQFGRVRVIKQRLVLSPRRYEQIGRAKLTFAYGLIATLYALGMPISMLAAIYRRTCAKSAAAPSFHTWRWRNNSESRNRAS